MGKSQNNNKALKAAQVQPFTEEELAEAVVFLAAALEETVDAVFLAHEDPEFLTLEMIEVLISTQLIAQILGETAAIQASGGWSA